jgi:hypothetical protein
MRITGSFHAISSVSNGRICDYAIDLRVCGDAMSERVIFLDIDGPIIPYTMFLIDAMASHNRVIPPLTVSVVRELCKRSGAKVVFNSTHNRRWKGVHDIDVAVAKAGLPESDLHPDMRTKYPDLDRDVAVVEWLSRHPEVRDWVAFDDCEFTEADNLIWVDPNAGLNLSHLNSALSRWGCAQFLVL